MKAGTTSQYINSLWQPSRQVFQNFTQVPLLKALLAAVIAFHDSFVEQHLTGVLALVGLVVLDQITGVICAIKKKEFASHRFRHGAVKLVTYIVLIAAFHLCSEGLGIEDLKPLDKVIIAWLLVTETLSVAENFQCSTGLKIPKWISEALKKGEGK
jgi:toxin secretion/phage lysis holin